MNYQSLTQYAPTSSLIPTDSQIWSRFEANLTKPVTSPKITLYLASIMPNKDVPKDDQPYITSLA